MDQFKLGLWDTIPGLSILDWGIIVAYVVMALTIGLFINFFNKSKKEEKGKDYFTAGGTMTWFWVGTSIVATTFAADTPLVLTGWIAEYGIARNWLWWGGVVGTVVMTVFFARKWKNISEGDKGAVTDAELVEMRYGKGPATVLRTIKAFFSSIIVNCVILGWVFAAVIKIVKPVIHWDVILGTSLYKTLEGLYPTMFLFKDDFNTTLTILVLVFFMLLYITKGGLKAVIIVDVVLFCVAMTSAIIIAIVSVREVGGLSNIWTSLEANYPSVGAPATDMAGKAYLTAEQYSAFIPSFSEGANLLGMSFGAFLLTLGVLWWMTGAVDGSGFTAQRFFSAKTAADAEKGALWYTWSNFILRTWPWVIAAVAALVLYPRPEMDKLARAATECLNKQEVCAEYSTKMFGADKANVLAACVENHRTCPIKGFTLLEKQDGWLAIDGMTPIPHANTAAIAEAKKATPVKVYKEDREISYPLLIRDYLPLGLVGLAFATLIGAFMSTVSTHINWGASYITNDFYVRMFKPDASVSQMKLVGRLSTVGLTIVALIVASTIKDIGVMWILWMGMMAGLGVPHLLRWLWWRANAWTELSGLLAGMILTLIQYVWTSSGNEGSFFLQILPSDLSFLANEDAKHITWVGVISAIVSVVTTLLTPAAKEADLREFAKTVTPMGFWKDLAPNNGSERRLGETVVYWLLGVVSIYTGMFGIGFFLRTELAMGAALIAVSAITMVILIKGMGRIDRHAAEMKKNS